MGHGKEGSLGLGKALLYPEVTREPESAEGEGILTQRYKAPTDGLDRVFYSEE